LKAMDRHGDKFVSSPETSRPARLLGTIGKI
jgi:hypothetical protein